eukprot:jgi/Undpi1/2176/HiC_scaffold_12.g05562.m1
MCLCTPAVPRLRNKHREWTLEHGGHTIWRCTSSLSSYLVASNVAKGRRVLELGAGMGVCGLIANKTGASAVVLTDGDSSAVKYLNDNIRANVGSAGESKMDESKTEMEEGDNRPVHAQVLRWGDTGAVKELMEVLETGHFDLVLGSDLIYPEAVKTSETLALMDVKVRDLMATAAAALMSGGTFLLAHECRSDLRDVMKLFETEGHQAAEKSDGADDASQGWRELVDVLQASGFGSQS